MHPASLQEVLIQFGQATRQRKLVGMRLERVYELAAATGHMKRFIVFGSFVTAKSDPNDVDVFLVMHDPFRYLFPQGNCPLTPVPCGSPGICASASLFLRKVRPRGWRALWRRAGARGWASGRRTRRQQSTLRPCK